MVLLIGFCLHFCSSAAAASGRGVPGAQVERVHVPAAATQNDDNAPHAGAVRFRRAHELGTTQADQRVRSTVVSGASEQVELYFEGHSWGRLSVIWLACPLQGREPRDADFSGFGAVRFVVE